MLFIFKKLILAASAFEQLILALSSISEKLILVVSSF